MEPQITIYVLECTDKKYYIGKTRKDVQSRFKDHQRGQGAEWTSFYPPIKIVTFFDGNDFDEDACTLKYMQLYGIDNVRGGSYVKLTLDEQQKSEIRRKIASAENKCFRCLKSGHFVHECPISTLSEKFVDGLKEVETKTKKLKFQGEVGVCFRCGWKGHLSKNCFAKNDRNGKSIEEKSENKIVQEKNKPKQVAILAIDIETRGAQMIKHGLYALGYTVKLLDGTRILKKRVVLDEEKKSFEPRCMVEFWSKHPQVLEQLEKEKQDPKRAMEIFVRDIKDAENKYDLRLVSNNPSFDISYVNYYLDYYLDMMPINYSFTSKKFRPIVDTDGVARGLLQQVPEKEWISDQDVIKACEIKLDSQHNHYPDEDAEYICDLYIGMCKTFI